MGKPTTGYSEEGKLADVTPEAEPTPIIEPTAPITPEATDEVTPVDTDM